MANVQPLKIEKLVFGGQALAHTEDGRAAFVWNALPGEIIVPERTQKRKGIFEAWAGEIQQKSRHRIEPVEAHWTSCSPWQIMDFAYENEQKIAIASEAYQHIGNIKWPELTISAPKKRFGYRNKIEFSFYINDDDEINLSFFGRSSKRKLPIESCELALPVINSVGKNILVWIREQKIPFRSLKSLIIRGSQDGKAIAALFIKDKLQLDLPKLDDQLIGIQLIYSTHKSPASVITEMLQTVGQQEMHENVGGIDFGYGPHSFFQVYVEVFEKALANIASHVPKDAKLLDFYAGVGSIGLPLSKHVKQVTLVEANAEAVDFAHKNIVSNSITNATAHCAPAEDMLQLITGDEVLIVDPPRAGLHEKVVQRILEVKPPKIIYLSCNVSTQARDLQLLTAEYKLAGLELFNFFPATPHIEGLAVLEAI